MGENRGAEAMIFYITLTLLVFFGLIVWWSYLIIGALREMDGNYANFGLSWPPSEEKRTVLRRRLARRRAGKWARCLASTICYWSNREKKQ
jgi:hypothetical protein